MAWPKKNSRAVVVDGERFLWHISGNRIDGKETLIAVGKAEQKYMLFIDPYPWDFEIAPSNITRALRWALVHGWNAAAGPSKYMAFSRRENTFVWLPDGIRFLHELNNAQSSYRE
ncbi:MAG: hypothetical protein JXR49_11365 [Acidobacteria bacterium]|nr:hypothetical protein [Acidobacteriota bacterium]